MSTGLMASSALAMTGGKGSDAPKANPIKAFIHQSDAKTFIVLRGCSPFIAELMYTDWTAVALLLFTSVPLLVVVATATFFIWQQRKKQLR